MLYLCDVRKRERHGANLSNIKQTKNIMALYEVTFSCGHTERIQLYGKHTDRERKIKWFEAHGKCSECYKASLPNYVRVETSRKDKKPYLVVDTKKSFDIKDTLKSLGYKWGRIEGHWALPISEATTEDAMTELLQNLEEATGLQFEVKEEEADDMSNPRNLLKAIFG